MSEKAGDEVEQLLQSWGLADLNAKFKSNYIVIQAFEYLTEEDIIELIPKIGQRAIFRGRLHQWRQENNITGFKQSHPAPNISVKFTETKESEVSLKPEPPKQSSPQLVQNILKIVKEEPVDNETKIQPQANCPPKTIPQTPDCPPKTLPQTPKLPENPLSGYIKKPIKQIVPKPLNKPQIKVLATRSEIQSQIKVLSTKSPAIPKPPATPKLPATPKQIQQSLGPTIPQGNHPINDMKIQHKVYGTLTMCNQNVKQLISPKPTAIQSKVQQFYISPVVDAPSSPPLAVQPFVQIHTQPTINLEHSPFVTSIIRVETSNCEKGSTSNEPLNNQQKKVNRTTILQKLTSTLPAKAIAHQQTSPKIPTVHHNSPQSQISTGQTTSLMMENYVDLEHGPLYPIVKMETNLSESNWEEYTEPQMEVNPEPLPQSEAVAGRNPDHTADEVMAEFTDDKEDSLDTDSAHELDSENDNTNSLLKRMPQKVASRSKGKTKVVNNPRKLEIQVLPTSRRKKSYKPRFDPFVLTNKEFIERYRFDKDTATFIIELINTEDQPSKRGMPLSGSLQVLTALRFFCKNALQCDLGELHGISQPTVSRVILRIAKKLALQHPNFISFPSSSRQLQKAKWDFLQIAGFPDIIGTIDCMHLEVKCPRKNVGDVMAEYLPNTKGYYPLNVQIVCDANCKILDISVKSRSSRYDSRIWTSSILKANLESTHSSHKGILLGHVGYPLSNILFTPVRYPKTRQEKIYNICHTATRKETEYLKKQISSKFRSIFESLRVDLETARNVVVAVAVLHNIAKKRNISLFDSDNEVSYDDEIAIWDNGGENRPKGRPTTAEIFRQEFINKHFV